MRYSVKITETLQRIVEVEVDSVESAISKVKDYYRRSKIVLDSSDYVSHSVEVFNEH